MRRASIWKINGSAFFHVGSGTFSHKGRVQPDQQRREIDGRGGQHSGFLPVALESQLIGTLVCVRLAMLRFPRARRAFS